MTQPFPLDATLDNGRLVLVECLSGMPEQGVYLAASVPSAPASAPCPPYYLATSALAPDDSAALRRRAIGELLLLAPGVAPLFGVFPIESDDVSQPPLVALLEACPAGVRSHEWRLPLPLNTAARLALGVAFTLAVAHPTGVGIGGIRPEHIFLNGEADAPELTGIAPRAERFWQMVAQPDFGIAPAYNGTYDAPELWARNSDSYLTPASDVFSLCATLAYWLTGKHPFVGTSAEAQVAAMRTGRRTPAKTNALLRSPLMRGGLAAHPAMRPTIGEVMNVLQRYAPDLKPAWENHVA